jgi:uncharacterized membrane protein
MTTSGCRALWLIIGLGTVARVVLAFTTAGLPFDIESLAAVNEGLQHNALHVYGTVNGGLFAGEFELLHWPYPPGLFPWIRVASGISVTLGIPLQDVFQLLPIAADAAIAWLVQDHLGRHGASARTRLAAAAVVAFGPSFLLVSGYQGQIDSVAILPAVAALRVWDGSPSARRALWAGLLIGVGASVKTVPLLMVVALLPTSRSPREAATVVAAAVAVPLVALAPFLIADWDAVAHALRYAGGPGLGGVSLLAQPEAARAYVLNTPLELNDAASALYHHGAAFVAAIVAAVSAFVLRHRPSALEAAVLLWLAIYALAPGFALQYVVWGLPFFIMAGHLRKVALMQALLLPASLILYMRPWESGAIATGFVAIMALAWVGWLAGLTATALRVAR